MDDHTQELLSRLLDGDLDVREADTLQRRLASDRELAKELDAMQRLRHAVSEIAEGTEPPAELDRLMEPLRQAPPSEGPRSRLVGRWLAAAAALVMGSAVLVEVAGDRRDAPIHKLRRTTPSAANDEPEVYQLQPLPTSAVPDDEIRLGVCERLAASPIPQPPLDEPPPLEVVGPLSRDPMAAGDHGPMKLLVIVSSGRKLSIPIGDADSVPAGGYLLRVTVKNARIVRVESAPDSADNLTAIRAAVVGVEVEGLSDGEYAAELASDEAT